MLTAAAPPPGNRAADRRLITAGEQAWGKLFVSGDVGAAAQLVADDFQGTDTNGMRYTKAMLLQVLRRGAPPLSASTTSVASIRFVGEVAIAEGVDQVVGGPPQRDRHSNAWTTLWTKRGGRWQLLSAQDSRIAARGTGPSAAPDAVPTAPVVPAVTWPLVPARTVARVSVGAVRVAPGAAVTRRHPAPVLCFVQQGTVRVKSGAASEQRVSEGASFLEPASPAVTQLRAEPTGASASLACAELAGVKARAPVRTQPRSE